MKNLLLIFLAFFVLACGDKTPDAGKTSEVLPECIQPDSLDAVAAAPNSHQVFFENENVRVLRVMIRPGEKEPAHTHPCKSVMYVEQPAMIRYYDADDKAVFESKSRPPADAPKEPNWMEPEGLHAVENIDTIDFIALRVELKK